MKLNSALLISITLILTLEKGISQSLTGLHGLAVTPSAEMLENGQVVLGSSYFSSKYMEYGGYRYNGVAGYVSVTFLPFVELSFRYTGQLRPITEENQNFPDRMPSVRVRVLKEKKWIPAIGMGVHDISSVDGGGAKHFEATYLVLTKNFPLGSLSSSLKVNTGYGFALFPASNHELDGLFGGLSITHPNFSSLNYILEYDSKNVNAAIKILLWKHLQLMTVLRGMDSFEGNIAFRTTLK